MYKAAYQESGRNFVPETYNEHLEEELYMFVKRRNETVSACHQRIRQLVRMLRNLPENAIDVDELSLVRYFKRAMPAD